MAPDTVTDSPDRPSPPSPSRSFGTPKLRTRIDPADGAFLWHRTRMYASTCAPPDGVPGIWLRALRRSGNTFTYKIAAAASAAELIVTGASRETRPHGALCASLAEAGDAVRERAAAKPAAGSAPPPLGSVQISRWIASATGPGASRDLHGRLLASIGSKRMGELRAWADSIAREHPAHIALHGELSLAAVFPQRDGSTAILYGESIARGPVEYDAGWLLGELAELSDVSMRNGNTAYAEKIGCHARSFLKPLLPVLDRETLGRCIVLRRLMHVIDYASFFGMGSLDSYIEEMPELVDSSGSHTLARMEITPPSHPGSSEKHAHFS
ncbi:hypothetical protein AB0D54_01975 [Streptomyces xanthophaeus]|uniref:hypothetical protein n=1 Tax=Streptomyces xanthophaeus TaxID=67385 RepID=UPI003425C29F